METDSARVFLDEGLKAYAQALRALRAFEHELGTTCAEALDEALGELSDFEVEPAVHKGVSKSSVPWVSALARAQRGPDDWQVWLGVYWNRRGDPRQAILEAYVWRASPEIHAVVEARAPEGVEVYKGRGTTHFGFVYDPQRALDEQLLTLARAVLAAYVGAAGTAGR